MKLLNGENLKKTTLSMQHLFIMFGATVLVPILTGLNVSVAILMAGIGTLLFHQITDGQVPVFLGSSFAFIAPIVAASAAYGVEYAQGGLVVAGLIYALVSAIVKQVGPKKVLNLFPPVITGSIIMVIGLKLAPTAIGMASSNWPLAILGFVSVIAFSMYGTKNTKIMPVLLGLVVSYIVALFTGAVDLTPVAAAGWIGLPEFTLAKFNWGATLLVAPVAIATMVEHLGDIATVGATVGKDFYTKPGLHKTLLGDGIATSVSAMVGGPANTTYSENIGALALTGVHDPKIVRGAAVFAIAVGLMPKVGAIISSIPTGIIGGISIILFGMIAAVGAKTLVEKHTDLGSTRNLIISSAILVLGLGGAALPVEFGAVSFSIEGMALAAIVGIVLNQILPE